MRLLAIDPGNTESGWVIIDTDDCRPVAFGKTENDGLRRWLINQTGVIGTTQRAVVEMIASYGMAVGAEVFETCVWIGRFIEHLPSDTELVKRQPVKLHHCHSPRATDANVRQALVDRFAKGVRNHGKGTKAEPGWFYGFSADVWQAAALAVYAADQLINGDRDHTD